MSDVAVELSQRFQPDHLKALGKEKAAELKGMAEEKVKEQATLLKERTKEMAMRKTSEWTENVSHSPKGLGLIGGILGMVAGAMIAKRLSNRGSERIYDEYTATGMDSGGASLRERASETAGEVKEKAVSGVEAIKDKAMSVKERTGEAMGRVKEAVPSASTVRDRTREWYSHGLEQQPLLFALGAVVLGMVGAFLVPVTDKERRLIEPARKKAQESLQGLGEQIEEKISSAGESGEESSGSVEMNTQASSPEQQFDSKQT
jgi:hypothetical protein